MNKLKVVLVCFVLALAGCKKEQVDGGGRFGMKEGSSAEHSALRFFDEIYNKNNLRGALEYSTPRMSRLLQSYHTAKAVRRHVINLRYDTRVLLEIDAGDSVGRQEFATKQKVSIYLSGSYQGDRIDELRTVQMLRDGDSWYVDRILSDKFL